MLAHDGRRRTQPYTEAQARAVLAAPDALADIQVPLWRASDDLELMALANAQEDAAMHRAIRKARLGAPVGELLPDLLEAQRHDSVQDRLRANVTERVSFVRAGFRALCRAIESLRLAFGIREGVS